MRQEELIGKVQTVLGLIDPNSLGLILPHEHLLTDLSSTYFVEPADATERKMAHEPIRLDNLYWVKHHRMSSVDDMKLIDEEVAIKEAMMFKMAGGSAIVELSNIGLARDPLGLARIAQATGLNIVMGAGYYIGASHPPELAGMNEEEIAEGIVRDIMVGVGDTGIRSGIIGEIGCSVPLQDAERKVLVACAIAQQRTGAPLNIHPSCNDDLVLEIIKILGDANADLGHTVISHCDCWGFSPATLHSLADAGCYIEYDTFGHTTIFTPHEEHYLDMPSDTQRLNDIIGLIAEGYLNHILIAGDNCFKDSLVAYGGDGYAHILRNVLPVMRDKGMSEEQINTLLVKNPKRMLTFIPAKD